MKRPALTAYLQTLMKELTVTNGDILAGAKALRFVTTTDALVSVKLSRLRRALASDCDAIVEAFEGLGAKYAVRDEAGAPVPARDESGVKVWGLTGTPALEIADHKAHVAEINALLAATVTLKLVQITEKDLASVTIPEQHTALVGDGLLPFVEAA